MRSQQQYIRQVTRKEGVPYSFNIECGMQLLMKYGSIVKHVCYLLAISNGLYCNMDNINGVYSSIIE